MDKTIGSPVSEILRYGYNWKKLPAQAIMGHANMDMR